MGGRAFVARPPRPVPAPWTRRAALGLSSAVAAAVAILLAACTDPPQPPQSTRPPSSPAASTPPTAEQLRCLREGAFLVDVGTELGRIVTTEGSEPGHADEERALGSAQLQLDLLLARPAHQPFATDRANLIADANQIIEGNQILMDRGHHDLKRQAYLEITAGGNEAITAAADARVKRASCLP
jgi:hypothetical protein